MTFDATGSFEVNLKSPAECDKLVVAGDSRTITLGSAALVITLGTAPAARSQEVFKIVGSTGTGSNVSGAFKYGGCGGRGFRVLFGFCITFYSVYDSLSNAVFVVSSESGAERSHSSRPQFPAAAIRFYG